MRMVYIINPFVEIARDTGTKVLQICISGACSGGLTCWSYLLCFVLPEWVRYV
ncbi:hypothetical protein BDV27DRAFT_138360, partial [Aspergillus caelatus]